MCLPNMTMHSLSQKISIEMRLERTVGNISTNLPDLINCEVAIVDELGNLNLIVFYDVWLVLTTVVGAYR